MYVIYVRFRIFCAEFLHIFVAMATGMVLKKMSVNIELVDRETP